MGVIVTNNRQLVDAPPVAPRRYGLFDAVGATLDMPPSIIASGLQFLVDHCGNEVETYDQTCVASPTKEFTEGSDVVGTLPYWLYTRKRCGTVGRTAEEMQRAAQQAFTTGVQTRVEDVLWDGNGLTGVTNLTNAGATIVTTLASGAGAAIAALEAAFYAVHGYVGTIHVNTAAYAAVAYSQLITGQGGAGALRTPIRSVWSFGAGYGITGPADVAPDAGNVWAFMTPQVTLWRSGAVSRINPRQTLDRALNQWDVLSEEVFAATWDCDTVFAVQVPVAAPGVVAVA
jgi:hypothetical protein